MRVMSIDPGGTVGWADWADGRLIEQDQDEPVAFLNMLEGTIANYDHLVIEEYRLRQSSAKAMIGDTFETSQVIGAIMWMARKQGVEVTTQSPAFKTFWDNDKLKHLGLYVRGKDHSRDAVRHGLYWWFNGKGTQHCPQTLTDILRGYGGAKR